MTLSLYKKSSKSFISQKIYSLSSNSCEKEAIPKDICTYNILIFSIIANDFNYFWHMTSKLKFTIEATKWKARAGSFTLNGVTVQTPCFMPVGTKATVKGLFLDMLQDPHYLGNDISPINLILANTYHLYLRPGADLIQEVWGLHKFENRPGLILTDSGGFQAFSLGLANKAKWGKPLAKLMDNGIKFKSIHDGSQHFFSPEGTVDIQVKLWSDIMMMLDVCSPPGISEKKYLQQLHMTHQRAKQQYDYMETIYDKVRWVLFPIVQGGTNLDLRQQSLEYLSAFAKDGIAVGGVSVGESQESIHQVVAHTVPQLPQDKPRYLMGVGDPKTMRFAVENGVDMFDCVMPTRFGRHGMFYTHDGYKKINWSDYKNDFSPLTDDCSCYACRNFTKAYLHHLNREGEMLVASLLSLHNIAYLHRMMKGLRDEILGG